jgi:pimeloyl-ACP methyl ester carboxylesterase
MNNIPTRLVKVNDIAMNVAELGSGPPLLLIHGWPEFWFTWAKIMPVLARQFRVIAPDLRGFGASDKTPAGRTDAMTAELHAADLRALLDALDLPVVGVVAHDIGALIGQHLIHSAPGRVSKFFTFDCPYPGIGKRWIEGGQIARSWYMWFHQTKLAAELVGHSRETCAIYMKFCLTGGCKQRHAFDDVFDIFVDNMMQPGNLQGGFNWYVGMAKPRPAPPPIKIPTRILWPEADGVFPVAWMDRLGEFFTDLQADIFPDVGHFPHHEAPDRAAEYIRAFFQPA